MAGATLRQRSSAVKRAVAAPLFPIASLCSPALATFRGPTLRRCPRRATQVVACASTLMARPKRATQGAPDFTATHKGQGVAGGLRCQARREGGRPFASSPFGHPIPQRPVAPAWDLFRGSFGVDGGTERRIASGGGGLSSERRRFGTRSSGFPGSSLLEFKHLIVAQHL